MSDAPDTELPPVLERDYSILLNDVGPDGELRSWIFFDFLQDIAARHAELLGCGMSRLRELGIIWVLSRIRLRIDSFPSFGDTLRIRTWPSGFQKLFATRQYQVTSLTSGREIASGSSFWLTLDFHSLRPIPPARTVNGLLPENKDRPFYFPDLGKLPAVEELTPVCHTAGQSVIDYNDHVNNAIYARYTQDWLASVHGGPVKIRDIQLNFNHAVKFGQTMQCGGILNGDGSFAVSGSVDGANVFQSSGHLAGGPEAQGDGKKSQNSFI